MPARHVQDHAPAPGDRLVRLGAVVFGLGVLAVLAVVVPFFAGRHNAPLPLALATLLLPLGLALALLGVLRAARSRRRRRARR